MGSSPCFSSGSQRFSRVPLTKTCFSQSGIGAMSLALVAQFGDGKHVAFGSLGDQGT
jgi:hypothetical protein